MKGGRKIGLWGDRIKKYMKKLKKKRAKKKKSKRTVKMVKRFRRTRKKRGGACPATAVGVEKRIWDNEKREYTDKTKTSFACGNLTGKPCPKVPDSVKMDCDRGFTKVCRGKRYAARGKRSGAGFTNSDYNCDGGQAWYDHTYKKYLKSSDKYKSTYAERLKGFVKGMKDANHISFKEGVNNWWNVEDYALEQKDMWKGLPHGKNYKTDYEKLQSGGKRKRRRRKSTKKKRKRRRKRTKKKRRRRRRRN